MRYVFNFIIALSILTIFAKCADPKFSEENMEKQALKIAELLDSSSIQIFHKWNYQSRGDDWLRLSGDSTIYACRYKKIKDTCYLTVYQAANFVKDFPCSVSLDTSKFLEFSFDKYNNNIFRQRFVDTNGEDHITNISVRADEVFITRNPFDTLATLTNLKNSLAVYGIVYRPHIGEFVEFWLSSRYKLTYLPDNLNLNPGAGKYWLEDFAGGKMIKKHWNLHKYDN